MLWNRSHSMAQLPMRTHLIFHRVATCAELFSTQCSNRVPVGLLQRINSELAGNLRRVWLQTLLWKCENKMNCVKRKTRKEKAKVKNWGVSRGTFDCLNLRVAAYITGTGTSYIHRIYANLPNQSSIWRVRGSRGYLEATRTQTHHANITQPKRHQKSRWQHVVSDQLNYHLQINNPIHSGMSSNVRNRPRQQISPPTSTGIRQMWEHV